MLTHKGLLNYVHWHCVYYSMSSADRAAHLASMAFDASMGETWPTLSVGGTLVQGISDDSRLVAYKLVEWMHVRRITISFLTTQLAETFLEEANPVDMSLRYLFTGGDRLHRGTRADVKYELVNIYGPTETTINVTLCKVPVGSPPPPM